MAFLALTLALGLNLAALFHLPAIEISAPGESASPAQERPQQHTGPWAEVSAPAEA